MILKSNKQISVERLLLSLLVLTLLGIFIIAYVLTIADRKFPPGQDTTIFTKSDSLKLEKFSSAEEFRQYLSRSQESIASNFGQGGFGVSRDMAFSQGAPRAFDQEVFLEAPQPQRVSETNVQVENVDEADIVKTDGRSIFYASQNYYLMDARPVMESTRESLIAPDFPGFIPQQPESITNIINAFPPQELSLLGEIDMSGELFLKNSILTVLGGGKINAYNVADPKAPQSMWDIEIDSGQQLVTSRLIGENLYLITQNYFNTFRPCPIPLFSNKNISIACTDIYHPIAPVPVDTLFTISKIDIKNGEILDKTTFVGTNSDSVVYMSNENMYISYSYFGNIADYYYNFFTDYAEGLIPSELTEKIKNLKDYDISQQSKLSEINIILSSYKQTLDEDDILTFESNFQNKLQEYSKLHMRDLQRSGIVKIDKDDFSGHTVGAVSGNVLNQFSMDEKDGNLRVVTTTGSRTGFISESENDVYVLDDKLQVIGEILGLGLSERVYSARFVGDLAYVVTFRETDPFYVIDLSNPKKPALKGELKIPGYSSYLHPLSETKILGVGMEGSSVKLSLFDVSNAENPQEVSKYLLSEYWSDVLNNYHAFLLDRQHAVFFIPGASGGYVFSYLGDELSLQKAISLQSARRAIYINDFMYILGDNEVVVLDEASWNRVNSLNF